MSAPLVSTIVLSYNHSQFILETLESVKAQTYKNLELILIDDCSSDDSVAVIEHWIKQTGLSCTFIRHEKNLGICKSLNDALAVATGKYVSMVASDDLWLPGKIAQQVVIMESQPESVGVLYSDAFQIDGHGNLLPKMFIAAHRNLPAMPEGPILGTLLEGNFIPGMTILIRRSCYGVVGPYDESLPWEDWDMWVRVARHFSFIYSPTPSAKYRVHDKSLMRSDPGRLARDVFNIVLKHFRSATLTEDERSKLEALLWGSAAEAYKRNGKAAKDILLALWQATRRRKALWMYRSAKAGVSYHTWEKAASSRVTQWMMEIPFARDRSTQQ